MYSNKNVKLIGAIIGIILFILLIAGATYAWVTWQSGNTKIGGKSGCFPDINYTNGTSFNTNNILLFDENAIFLGDTITVENGMALLGVTASVNNGCNTPVTFGVDLEVTNLNSNFMSGGDSAGAFKYVLASYDPTLYSSVSYLVGQSLEVIQKNSIMNTGRMSFVSDNAEITSTNRGYVLIFYVDGDMAFNGVQNSNFGVKITGKAVQIEK